MTTLTTLQGSFEAGTSSLKKECNGYDAEARPTIIGQKMSLAQDELLEIKDSNEYDRHITKLVAADRNEYMVVLICQFDLYYIMLRIIDNTDVFDGKRCVL